MAVHFMRRRNEAGEGIFAVTETSKIDEKSAKFGKMPAADLRCPAQRCFNRGWKRATLF